MAEKLISFEEAIKKYDPVFGIEVHVELGTNTKMFCPSSFSYEGEPNTETTAVSLGLPGTLPVLNNAAYLDAIKIGLALNCSIAEYCRFARKQYFYPDLTKNYQTSQSDEPIAYEGSIEIELDDGEKFTVGIERAHMEEDAGKNTHIGETGRIQGADYSLIDYNRAGVPLVEIVSHPVDGTGARVHEVASKYVQTLRDIFKALGVSEARMEKGNVRADVNLSLKPKGSSTLGTRTETKNVNSFKSIESAIKYEVRRQATLLDAGESILQETRHFHADSGHTSAGRIKSDSDDYRYFPDPDLVPIVTTNELVESIRKELPELPHLKKARLQSEWGISQEQMRDVVNAGAVQLIEDSMAEGLNYKSASKWWMGELSRVANDKEVELDSLGIAPSQIAEIEQRIGAGTLNDKLGRQVIDGLIAGEGSVSDIISKRGLELVQDDNLIEDAVEKAFAAEPDILPKLQSGNMAPIGAIIGAVMKATQGKADAGAVRATIMKKVNA
jgi:aspartyl-tRNA(Asn)/glutamyl-tRNA(Gln) amidotransferase subunit B